MSKKAKKQKSNKEDAWYEPTLWKVAAVAATAAAVGYAYMKYTESEDDDKVTIESGPTLALL